jgi:hypothetical protein
MVYRLKPISSAAPTRNSIASLWVQDRLEGNTYSLLDPEEALVAIEDAVRRSPNGVSAPQILHAGLPSRSFLRVESMRKHNRHRRNNRR